MNLNDYGPYKVHLNGGPRDDDYTTFHVGIRRQHGGHYEVRQGADGRPVPHGTNGWVECDWVAA